MARNTPFRNMFGLFTLAYAPTACESAEEAFDQLYRTSYDLIISDIMMPRIDGFELARTEEGGFRVALFCASSVLSLS